MEDITSEIESNDFNSIGIRSNYYCFREFLKVEVAYDLWVEYNSTLLHRHSSLRVLNTNALLQLQYALSSLKMPKDKDWVSLNRREEIFHINRRDYFSLLL